MNTKQLIALMVVVVTAWVLILNFHRIQLQLKSGPQKIKMSDYLNTSSGKKKMEEMQKSMMGGDMSEEKKQSLKEAAKRYGIDPEKYRKK